MNNQTPLPKDSQSMHHGAFGETMWPSLPSLDAVSDLTYVVLCCTSEDKYATGILSDGLHDVKSTSVIPTTAP